MNDLLVMKFGGTSVGSAERMRVAARISAEQKRQRPAVVVVSAMSKITDLLLETTRHAEPRGVALLTIRIDLKAAFAETRPRRCMW